jgi:ferritin-like metal-binding protein YciE
MLNTELELKIQGGARQGSTPSGESSPALRAVTRPASGIVDERAVTRGELQFHHAATHPEPGGTDMPGVQADAKVSQYLSEAQATEQALIQTLQAHIAMTPAGSYREALEGHLDETREHSRLIAERQLELSSGRSLLGLGVWAAELGVGVAQSVAGRLLATWKAPIDLLRGSGGEEKLLKNAKEECASEALEIATYEALERLAGEVGDRRTAELARRIRRDEERMLARLREEIKDLAVGVVQAEVGDRPTYRPDQTGTADAVRGAARRAGRSARRGASAADRADRAGEAGAGGARAAGRRASGPAVAAASKLEEAAAEAGGRPARARGARRPGPASDTPRRRTRRAEVATAEPGRSTAPDGGGDQQEPKPARSEPGNDGGD